jgi:bacterioferritin-associated ferredoxin
VEPAGDGKLDPGILGQSLDIYGAGDIAQNIQFTAFKGEYLRVRIAVDDHVELFDFRAPDVIQVKIGLGAKCGHCRKKNRKKRKEKPQEIFHGNPPLSFGR